VTQSPGSELVVLASETAVEDPEPTHLPQDNQLAPLLEKSPFCSAESDHYFRLGFLRVHFSEEVFCFK
jgi:hypothetical protein